MQQVLLVGNDRKRIEQSLSTILSYYLLPSATLWSENKSDKMLIGGSPSLVKEFDKSVVVADYDNKRIFGGEKNDFCAQVLEETEKYAQHSSVPEARAYFQRKISTVFTVLKDILRSFINSDSPNVGQKTQDLLWNLKMEEIHLLARISRNVNPFLARMLEKYLDPNSRLQDLFQ